jgi:DnaJ-domain-containing protein 1
MSLGRRFINVARAEVSDWFRKLQDVGSSTGEEPAFAEPPRADPLHSRRGQDPIPPEIARYYANLELPVGASADEVRAAYKRLMRRYHPDHHHTDSGRNQAATELARELRVAYESVLEHLGARR